MKTIGCSLLVLLVALCLGDETLVHLTDENANQAYPLSYFNEFEIVNYISPITGSLIFKVDEEEFEIYIDNGADVKQLQLYKVLCVVEGSLVLYSIFTDEPSEIPSRLWVGFVNKQLTFGKDEIDAGNILYQREQASVSEEITITNVVASLNSPVWFVLNPPESGTSVTAQVVIVGGT
ncbi:hypothetical protein CAPTEDRAFT_210708 [Capitella teleta]|uniref:Farnesoic acid O-methyl transferase domain-containing protein n=1 Tax=Capitella teleta TaxID=283909 RepID=R7UHX4_CAPTE|nr:hypothetical protein CAPTEDRAFT_210708 [Capitella teleta]|eukprot:ELU02872.1 hypothetical protein CAPTEDRAFT_210708 [Capitella teleta]